MVDFKKLRRERAKPKVIEPEAIFRRLPRPPGIKDIYVSQKEVLDGWFARREKKDLVIKLNTGGGKTLIGLLVAQSIMNEREQPVLYLAPNNQLVAQILDKAAEYNIAAP